MYFKGVFLSKVLFLYAIDKLNAKILVKNVAITPKILEKVMDNATTEEHIFCSQKDSLLTDFAFKDKFTLQSMWTIFIIASEM